MLLDAFGKQCPMPLVMVKKALGEGATDVQIKVDNDTAVKNLSRLAQKQGLGFAVEAIEGGYLVKFSGEAAVAEAAQAPVLAGLGSAGSGYAFFVGKDHVGEGDPTLGRNLMKMAIYTLAESDDVPSSVLFMNSGVKLVCGEEPQVVESCN